MIEEHIRDSEALGIKGLCRAEELEAYFSDDEIREAVTNGAIWSPRPRFFKVCDKQ